jgi:hypothetical protein
MTTELASKLEGEVGPVLDLCDRIVGELGRRGHMFTWLRAPDADREDWLAVDAYYPANKLVVVWREQPSPDDHLYTELVPNHGLRLLQLDPGQWGGDAESELRQMIASLGPSPRRAHEPQVHEREAPVVAPAPTLLIARPAADSVTLGVLEGFLLAIVMVFEIYVGVVHGALDSGRPLLAFALALDACARALGTIAAGRVGAPDWAWGCALVGSPLVAVFALARREGPVRVEPAPLAGLMAVVALAALAIALLSGS